MQNGTRTVQNRIGSFLESHARLVRRFDLVFSASCAIGLGKDNELAVWVHPQTTKEVLIRFANATGRFVQSVHCLLCFNELQGSKCVSSWSSPHVSACCGAMQARGSRRNTQKSSSLIVARTDKSRRNLILLKQLHCVPAWSPS